MQELHFIGPPANVIERIGNKDQAKNRMAAANIPKVPGYSGDDQSIHAAESIGYPILLKAAAGGGGKGIRLVTNARELNDPKNIS